ncbi:hypothetical protein WBP06_24645 [Novosphingobium sp. BL-8H]|uniref:hypothetical protein n=1 Tax=Novosphingobium sp. BL-8H TaxID=3127640 RepID=UPI003756A585
MTASTLDDWTALWRSWTDFGLKLSLAPQDLMQSINSGWSFGNVIVNQQNSSAPGTEQAILAQQSYGRQIGKMLDALCLLVERQPDAGRNTALKDVVTLHRQIDTIKKDAALRSVKQVGSDLETLRASDRAEDKEALQAALMQLRTLVAELEKRG